MEISPPRTETSGCAAYGQGACMFGRRCLSLLAIVLGSGSLMAAAGSRADASVAATPSPSTTHVRPGGSVEQTVTDSDCDGTTPDYYGWYEMYPADPVYFSNPVAPGDSMSASVTFSGAETYNPVVTDNTQD